MKQILFATGNESKAKRFNKYLLEKGIEVITLNDIGINIEVEENGTSAIENALIKARAYSKETGLPTLAMDDTLYLENVPEEKQPGMYVRRVNGKRLTDEEMIEHYSNLVRQYGKEGKLVARWVYGMALIKGSEEFTYTWSLSNLYLVDTRSSSMHPGYPLDSISIDSRINKYLAEITEEDKLLLEEDESHVADFIASHID